MYRVNPSSATMVVLSPSGVGGVGEANGEVNGSQVEGERICVPEGVTLTSPTKPPCHDAAKIIIF